MRQSETIALLAVRRRAAALADAILRAESAQAHLAIAFDAAADAGCGQEDVDRQVALATDGRPDRARALARLALLDRKGAG